MLLTRYHLNCIGKIDQAIANAEVAEYVELETNKPNLKEEKREDGLRNEAQEREGTREDGKGNDEEEGSKEEEEVN